MREGMVGNFMTGGVDCLHLEREFRGALTDDKEGRPGFKSPQDLEHPRRMDGVWTVVDREPDFALFGLEVRQTGPHHWQFATSVGIRISMCERKRTPRARSG